MNNTAQNVKVGFLFLVFISLILVATVIVKGGIKQIFAEGRKLTARFDTVENLSVADKVYFSGVPVGKVTKIEFTERWVDVELSILEEQVKIFKGSTITVQDMSTLGGKQVSISRGNPALGEIDWNEVQVGVASPQLSMSVQGATDSFTAFVEENRKNFADIVENLKNTSVQLEAVSRKVNEGEGTVPRLINDPTLYENLNRTVESTGTLISGVVEGKGSIGLLFTNSDIYDRMEFITRQIVSGRGTLGQMLTNEKLYDELEGAVINVGRITRSIDDGKGTLGRLVNDPDLYDSLSSIAGRIERGEGALGRLLKEDVLYTEIKDTVANLKGITERIDSIAEKIDSGRGTVGKLINDTAVLDKTEDTIDSARDILSAFKKFKTILGASMKYHDRQDMAVGRVYVRVETSPSKFLLVGGSWLILSPQGEISYAGQFDGESDDDTFFQPEIQLGFKFFDNILSLRLGLIEGQFGGGFDLDFDLPFLFDSQVRFTMDGRIAFGDRDFDGSKIDEQVSPMVARFEASLFLFNHVRLFVGAHNFFQKIGLTAGIAFEYHDSDIRDLIGFFGLAS